MLCALRFCKFLRHLRQFTYAVFLNLLRKVCDPAVERGTGDWRQLRSEELQDICCSSDVIRATSSRRMICTGRKDGLSLRLLTLGVLIQFACIDKMCCASRKSVYQWAVCSQFNHHFGYNTFPLKCQRAVCQYVVNSVYQRRLSHQTFIVEANTVYYSPTFQQQTLFQGACSITILRIHVSTSH